MDAPTGPSPIAKNGQISLPKAVTEVLGWGPGDLVYFVVDDEEPEVLRIVPKAVVARRYTRGDRVERLERLTASDRTLDASSSEAE